ncbi:MULTISPECIES: serine/threonine protein kinase [Cyanophyceae]|uniref:serine/threonine protein kinase n=1 Tax=Cyanophyceae TaxID=3028117 RepID=UPI0023300D3E|nr:MULTISPECIES: serine/threonine-protein kinase [Cyanophyceae]MDB9354832.1 serine/threonine-protein kinase [Nodularia spumigena CS-587/03]MDB9338838.1 serine/threonine-protein kinase [Nodularia spumigena CS-589/07]MDB9402315.1 serine/threonine-protein kinase [Microcystis aeruginosa CS-567/02-A1]MDB9499441.1 serine/threonine-protein kinase [Nodularia spumigena CS-336/02]MDB9533373.1 serine/threonine-protein kinase [Nodularia spumigena CS-1038]
MSYVTCRKGHKSTAGSNFCSTCGELLQNSSHNLDPTLIGIQPGTRFRDRYIFRELIGQGGFGRTYIAEDTGRFNEQVAIKEFIPSLQGTGAFNKAVELFQREAVTLYQLQHPQIPRFWECFQENSRLFLVEDFIEGRTYESLLNERLRQGRCFTEAEIMKLFQDLLPVLSYLHIQGIVHRDISPDNIILSSKTELPVLIDMGAVKQVTVNVATNLQTTPPPRGTSIGKVGYAPDEQIRLGIVAPNSDFYALAVTAIVLMTGKQPQQLLDQYTLTWTWDREITVSSLMSQALNRMLAPRGGHRFQSADEVLSFLGLSQTHQGYSTPNYSGNSTPAPANNSGCGRIFDKSIPVPQEIKGWNWGAFLLGGFWSIGNKVWIGLLCCIPYIGFVMLIILGIKGNEWAWKSRRWSSVEAFKANQRTWATVGLCLTAFFVVIGFLIGLSGG